MYQNNKYTEFLEFLVRFFAYWRIDEHYATETNRGADIFAEAWAPMVDTSKFFYYTNETTYVKTERMLDCFNHIPGVLYCDLPEKLELGLELPTNISKRGYIFDGWYTNSDYSGNKVTTITQSVLDSYVDGKVVLYAKWVEDVEAMNKDLAATVDVIINNLIQTSFTTILGGVKLLSFADVFNSIVIVYIILGIGIGVLGSRLSMKKYLDV